MLQRGRGIAGVAGNTLSLKRIWKPNANIMAATVAHSVRPRKHTTPYLENETTATLHKTHAALPPNINVTLRSLLLILMLTFAIIPPSLLPCRVCSFARNERS